MTGRIPMLTPGKYQTKQKTSVSKQQIQGVNGRRDKWSYSGNRNSSEHRYDRKAQYCGKSETPGENCEREMDQSNAMKEKCLQIGTTKKPQISPCQKQQIRQSILEKPSTDTTQHQILRK